MNSNKIIEDLREELIFLKKENHALKESYVKEFIEQKRIENALKESEERYRLIINSSDDMVFLKDDHLKYLLVNDPLATFFGAEKCDIIGKAKGALFILHYQQIRIVE